MSKIFKAKYLSQHMVILTLEYYSRGMFFYFVHIGLVSLIERASSTHLSSTTWSPLVSFVAYVKNSSLFKGLWRKLDELNHLCLFCCVKQNNFKTLNPHKMQKLTSKSRNIQVKWDFIDRRLTFETNKDALECCSEIDSSFDDVEAHLARISCLQFNLNSIHFSLEPVFRACIQHLTPHSWCIRWPDEYKIIINIEKHNDFRSCGTQRREMCYHAMKNILLFWQLSSVMKSKS